MSFENPQEIPGDAPDLRARIEALPKTEHHLHIEGSITLEEYREVVQVPDGWEPAAWSKAYRYPTFEDFESFVLGYGGSWFSSPERYHLTARNLFARKQKENIRYVECSFAAILSQIGGLPLDEVVDAVVQAIPEGLEVRVFMGLHHDGWVPEMVPALERALTLPGLDGIDLHGPEGYPVREWLADYWPAARRAGKATKAHAGELGGAWHVREAVEKLGVRRIEHGFRAAEDPAVVDLLLEKEVVLDVCPISNYKLKTVPDLETHPVRELHRAGVACTLNTDDPFVFGNLLADDYEAVVREVGCTTDEMLAMGRNGFACALVEEDRRRAWLKEYDAAAAAFRNP